MHIKLTWSASISLFLILSSFAIAGQAKIDRTGDVWTLANDKLAAVIEVADGKVFFRKLTDRVSHQELIAASAPGDAFSFQVGGKVITGASGGWTVTHAEVKELPHGARQLDLALGRQGGLAVTCSYVLYPDSAVIRQWLTFKNVGSAPIRIDEPSFLHINVAMGSEPEAVDFNWMSGGENSADSWLLKTEQLKADQRRKFDSYDPFPARRAPGDGIDARIQLNDKQIWPAAGWQYVADATVNAPFDVTTSVAAGDRLIFRVNMHSNLGWDTTDFDPTIAYDDGETHVASKEFSSQQGKNGWRYQYVSDGKFTDLAYYAGPAQWRKALDNPTGTPFVGAHDQHPDAGQDSVRVWTAPKAGKVHVTGSVCNIGNKLALPGGGGFKPGTASYAPWYALYDRTTHEGLFIGWDYFGHWSSSFERSASAGVAGDLRVAGHHQTLAPGESFSTPKSFIGLFQNDLDNAGNELLDWQYAYLWDQTRDGANGTYPWFPALRTLGFWMKGTGWGKVGWTGGKPDVQSTFLKVFRVADYMRQTGVDVYHRDWGWWDIAGDWNGPDFRATNDYLRKSKMGELIYAFLYTVAPESKVARTHPEWIVNGTLDLSRPQVVQFMLSQLDSFVARWGDFEWRNDSFFTTPGNGDDTPLLTQDQGFRLVLRSFLDKYPGCSFQAVNGGGNYCGYEYVGYASSISFSDGAVGPLRNYYAALLFPPDKTSDIPDIYNPDAYDKSAWRGLLCMNYDTTGDTWDSAKLEGIRQLNDIYHYLLHDGVVGRWVHVYRPLVEGDDATMYFQRLSRDGQRGIIIPKHVAPGPITIHPKGLLADQKYIITFQESDERSERAGADLMEHGIRIEKMPPGELIYLNLPLHPGSKLDVTPPTAPSDLRLTPATNMGFPGIELDWKPGTDDNWVSYYQVFRDGIAIDKVAKGNYYFDHSAGADPAAKYELCTVDGAGNASPRIAATVAAAIRCQVIDDAAPEVAYTGDWKHEQHLQPAYAGTISHSKTKGAKIELHVRGKRVLIFSRLTPTGGKAAIAIDGAAPETVDSFDADDIWGACVYQREFAEPGDHLISITLLGEKSDNATDTEFWLDGIRAEPE